MLGFAGDHDCQDRSDVSERLPLSVVGRDYKMDPILYELHLGDHGRVSADPGDNNWDV